MSRRMAGDGALSVNSGSWRRSVASLAELRSFATGRVVCSLCVLLLVVTSQYRVEGGGSFNCPPEIGSACWTVFANGCQFSSATSAFNGCLNVATGACGEQLDSWSLPNLQISRIQAFKNCPPTLTSIDLRSNNISSKMLGSHPLLQGLSRLTHLQLSYNHLTALGSVGLRDLSSLQHLNVSHNLLQRLEDQAFASLARLLVLDLSHNRLTGSLSASTFTALTKLTSLYLQDNKLVDVPLAGMQQLMGNSNHLLDVSANQIPSLDTARLGTARLRIAGNPLVCNFSLCGLATLPANRILDADGALCAAPSTVTGLRVLDVFNLLRCGSRPCVEHHCESLIHPSHASCAPSSNGNLGSSRSGSSGLCTCTAPLYASNGLHCICAAGSRLKYHGLCNANFGPKCLLNYTCQDINECVAGTHNCNDQRRCVNTLGSFQCVDVTEVTTAAVTAVTESSCDPSCLGTAECVRRGDQPSRCECLNGYHGDGYNCTWSGGFPTMPPPKTVQTRVASDNSKLILIIAIVGGVAGLLALLYVLTQLLRKCRRQRSKAGVVHRQPSQRSNVSFMHPNMDYETSSLDGRARGGFGRKKSFRKHESPIYASAEQVNGARAARSILYDSNKKDGDGYAKPENVVVGQNVTRSASLDSHGRRLPPPIDIQGSTMASPRRTSFAQGPKPGAKHPYVVLNVTTGEPPMTPLSPPGNRVTFSAEHMYHSPQDSGGTTTSLVSESDMDNLQMHRDDHTVPLSSRRPVALIRPYDQACINPQQPNEVLRGSSAVEELKKQTLSESSEDLQDRHYDVAERTVKEDVTLKHQHHHPAISATLSIGSNSRTRIVGDAASTV